MCVAVSSRSYAVHSRASASTVHSAPVHTPVLCSFSKVSVTSRTSQLILQPFRRFTYVTAHSPTLPLLHLRHSSFSNPSFASLTSQALHLRHLASRPCHVLHVMSKIVNDRRRMCMILSYNDVQMLPGDEWGLNFMTFDLI